MSRHITKSALARLANCTRQVVGRKLKKGEPLHEALTEEDLVDIDHSSVIAWLKERDIETKPENLTSKDFDNMQIKDISDRYGSVKHLENVIKIRKMLVETEHKEIQLAASREELVSREFVGKACWGLVDIAFTQLLEVPRGAIPEIEATLETKTPGCREEAEKLLTEHISIILQNAKTALIERLGSEIST